MKIEPTLGNPTEPGIYAVRQWYCWRILEWFDGAWWHEGRIAKWPASAMIEAHFGPLPRIVKDFTKPPLGKPQPEYEIWEDAFFRTREREFDDTDSTPSVQEYDL